jgi:putative transposase
MSNHIHGVIVITGPCKGEASDFDRSWNTRVPGSDASPLRPRLEKCTGEKSFAPTDAHATPQSPSKTIGSIVRGFKIGVTKWFRADTDVYWVWPRNYYEQIHPVR